MWEKEASGDWGFGELGGMGDWALEVVDGTVPSCQRIDIVFTREAVILKLCALHYEISFSFYKVL